MRIRSIWILALLASCSNNGNQNSINKTHSFVYPKSVDSGKYAEIQNKLRKEYKSVYTDTVDILMSKKERGILKEIQLKESCLFDSSIITPYFFNLDTKKDFISHGFISRLSYIESKDTIFSKTFTNELFSEYLDSNLNRYGVIKQLNGYGNSMPSKDSIKAFIVISIPATTFSKRFVVSFDYSGKYTIYPYDDPNSLQ